MNFLYSFLLIALSSPSSIVQAQDHFGEQSRRYFSQVDFSDIEKDVVASARGALLDSVKLAQADEEEKSSLDELISQVKKELENNSIISESSGADACSDAADNADSSQQDKATSDGYREEIVQLERHEIKRYFNFIGTCKEQELLRSFARKAGPDTLMHIGMLNSDLFAIPEVQAKIASSHPLRLAAFLLKPGNNAFIAIFCKLTTDSQFLSTIQGSEQLQRNQEIQARLLSLKEEQILDFIEHPANDSLRKALYNRIAGLAPYLALIEEENRAIAKITSMERSAIVELIRDTQEVKLVDLFCRKAPITDLITVAMTLRQLLRVPTVLQRIADAPLSIVRDFLLDSQNRDNVYRVVRLLPDEKFCAVVGGCEALHKLEDIQLRVYDLGTSEAAAFLHKPQNARFVSLYRNNSLFQKVLDEEAHKPRKNAHTTGHSYEGKSSWKETPVRRYRGDVLGEFRYINGQPVKKEDPHADMQHQLRVGLDLVADDLAKSTYAQGNSENEILGSGGLLERYLSEENRVQVKKALLKAIPTATENELAELAFNVEIADLVYLYDPINARIKDPIHWERVEKRIVKLFDGDDFDQLLTLERNFIGKKAHDILIRSERANFCARLLKNCEVHGLLTHPKAREVLWQCALEIRKDERMAHELEKAFAGGCKRLFKYEAEITYRLLNEKAQRYENGDLAAEYKLAVFGDTLSKHLDTPEFQKLIEKKGVAGSAQFIRQKKIIEECIFNGPLRNRFGVTVREWTAMGKAYDFDPRGLIRTYDDPDQEKIQYESVDVLKRFLEAPAYAQPIMGDFSRILFHLNTHNEKERAFELIDYLKQFSIGAITEFGSQSVSQVKGLIVGGVASAGITTVLGYLTPLSTVAGKLYFPYMVASGVYGIYRNWDAFKADLEGCKAAILEGRPFDAGKNAVRMGVDITLAAIGCRMMKNTLSIAHKNGIIDDAAKVMNKGGRDTARVTISKEVSKRAHTHDGLEKLYDEYIVAPAVPIDKEVFLEQVNTLKDVPGFLKPSSPLVKVFEGRNDPAVKGFLYEIELAANLKRKGEKILGLGLKIKRVELEKEFDIMTSGRLIECKSFNWSLQNQKKVMVTLINQKRIADDLKMNFELHSRTKIPDDWKKLLLASGIKFFEES